MQWIRVTVFALSAGLVLFEAPRVLLSCGCVLSAFQLLRSVGVLQLRSVCTSTAACCPSSQACSVSAVGRPCPSASQVSPFNAQRQRAQALDAALPQLRAFGSLVGVSSRRLCAMVDATAHSTRRHLFMRLRRASLATSSLCTSTWRLPAWTCWRTKSSRWLPRRRARMPSFQRRCARSRCRPGQAYTASATRSC